MNSAPTTSIPGLSHEEHEVLLTNIRRYLESTIAPLISAAEAAGEFPWQVLPAMAEFGYITGSLSEEDGGYGLSNFDYAHMMREAGRIWLSLRVTINTQYMAARILAAHGTPEQKTNWLEPILRGEKPVWFAITEPNAGSDVSSVKLRAVPNGDHYLLSGNKLWITNGATADHGILLANVAESSDEPGGLTAFLINRADSPYEARRLKTMVLRGTTTSELGFHDTPVPRENRIGGVGEGLHCFLVALNYGRLNVAMGAVGAAESAYELAKDYAINRTQFGRPIGSYQLVQRNIVEMHMRVEAARGLALSAAKALDLGQKGRVECSAAKLYAAQAAHEVASMAQGVFGGAGYSEELPIERIFRDTRGAVIPEGTTEIQTLILGRELLGLSAFK